MATSFDSSVFNNVIYCARLNKFVRNFLFAYVILIPSITTNENKPTNITTLVDMKIINADICMFPSFDSKAIITCTIRNNKSTKNCKKTDPT